MPVPSNAADESFATLWRCFDTATRRDGLIAEAYRIADRRVRVEVAGDAAADLLLPALEHLRFSFPTIRPADLSIRVWCGGHLAVPPWAQCREVKAVEQVTFVHNSVKVVRFPESEAFLAYDHNRRRGIVWHPSPHAITTSQRASPFREFFQWWASQIGGLLAHAAAVGLVGQGILLVGKGGSGKSSTTLQCLQAGWCTAGDDHVLVTLGERPTAHSLYQSLKITNSYLGENFGTWTAQGDFEIRERDKTVLLFDRHRPGQLVDALPLAAIVHPCVTPAGRNAVERLTPGECLLRMAPSTVLLDASTGAYGLAQSRAIVERLPGYRLQLGGPTHEIPALLASLLPTAYRAAA